jgi:hypothetical protein
LGWITGMSFFGCRQVPCCNGLPLHTIDYSSKGS